MSDRFFENKDCKYYPCHKGMKEINCLFCFCPWFYHCGSKKVEPCENCTVPHHRDSYDMLMQGIREIKRSQDDVSRP
jgi:Zn-finger protein